jgi:F-type H+-transporting ATPase subunit gamma
MSCEEARGLSARALTMIEAGEFDVCTIIFNRFRTVISQIATKQQLIPFAPPPARRQAASLYRWRDLRVRAVGRGDPRRALPNNLAVQIYMALLENAASEQGGRDRDCTPNTQCR